MAVTFDDGLLKVRMDRRFGCGHETGAEQRAIGAESEGGGETTAVGDAAGTKHRQRRHRFDHHRQERQRRHPTDMAASFCALRDQNIGAGFGGALRFGNFTGHMHHFATGVMGALKILAQILLFARPGEGDDRWTGAQCDREHVFMDLKQ